MPFQKGTPKPAASGRKKGSINKTTASVKEALREAFDLLGGVESLIKWGKQNQTEFYKLWGRMLPQEIELAAKMGAVQVQIVEEIVDANQNEEDQKTDPAPQIAG